MTWGFDSRYKKRRRKIAVDAFKMGGAYKTISRKLNERYGSATYGRGDLYLCRLWLSYRAATITRKIAESNE